MTPTWWVLCWQDDNEGDAVAIGPYLSVEQCEFDVAASECSHKHQFGRGAPAIGFKVALGYSRDDDQQTFALGWFRCHAPAQRNNPRRVLA